MGSYQPFLIANFRVGLELDLEPWLLPQDAFKTLDNAFLRRGILQKRLGYTEFADTGDAHPIIGLMNYVKTDGSNELLVHDTKRLFTNSAGVLTDIDGSDKLSGSDQEFINWVNWDGTMYMTNNNDRPRTYNGTVVADFDMDIDGGGNDVTTVAFFAVQKERLITFRNTEGGTLYPQRARWCAAGNPADWTGDEFVDCPTAEWIQGVAYRGDDIVVYFDSSVWILKYTGNSVLPFRWEQISVYEGSAAPFSPIALKQDTFAMSKIGVTICDGINVDRIDSKIPDIVESFDSANVGAAFSWRDDSLEHLLMLYPSPGNTDSDKALVLNYDDASWANFGFPFTVMGDYTVESGQTWTESAGVTWANDTGPWLESSNSAGFPTILAGDLSGKVFKLNDTGQDDGSDISFEVMSGRWNPYTKAGMKARLGYIDFLVSSIGDIDVSVDFYLDFEDVPYVTQTLSFDQSAEKSWVRLYAGAVGSSHRIRLYHTESGRAPQIHAIMPFFKPLGRLNRA